MHALYRQALRYLDDLPADAEAIESALELKWPEFDEFSYNMKVHLIAKMVELKEEGLDSNIPAAILSATDCVQDVPADRLVIRRALSERWPEFGLISDDALRFVVAEVYKTMKEKEDAKGDVPFRRALHHLGDISNDNDAIRTALEERWPDFQTFDNSSGSFLIMKLSLVMMAGPRDPDWILWFRQNALKSKGAKSAAEWLCQSMQSRLRQVWLLGCSYYRPEREDFAPLIWEIGIVNLRTGALVLSTKVDYKSANAWALYKKLWGQEPVPTSNRFIAFNEEFERHYDGQTTHGMLLGDIERKLRKAGYDPNTHQVLSYNDELAVTAMAKLFMGDHRISTKAFELKILNPACFQPISIYSLVKEMLGPGETSDDLGYVFANMFPNERDEQIPTAESHVKALWKVCSRLYQVLKLHDKQ
ncbi:hypothetical protein HDK77DRAFT_429503 [Phyllosticta capitalensis]